MSPAGSLLDVDPPEPARFDTDLQARIVSQYEAVSAALEGDNRTGAWEEQYRNAAAEAFFGPRLVEWQAEIRAAAARMCRGLSGTPSVDLVHEFARPMAAAIAAIVTGQASPEAALCARAIFASAADPFDPSLRERSNAATTELAARLGGKMAPLNVQAFVALSESLPAFLANSAYALLSHNQRFLPTAAAMEELLRYAAPSKAQLRHGSQGLTVLLLASANRDPTIFPEPDRLSLERAQNRHLAFGAGPHACVGGALTRMAATAALQALFEACPNLTLIDAEPGRHFALRTMKSLQASSSTTPHPSPR